MADLFGVRVVALASDGFEEADLIEPVKALRAAGAQVVIVAPRRGDIQGFGQHSQIIKIAADQALAQVDAGSFDAVHLPGGTVNADNLRHLPEALAFLRAMQEEGKPIAAIGQAVTVLVAAELVAGRSVTGAPILEEEGRRAGGQWVDRDVVEDDNLHLFADMADALAEATQDKEGLN